MDQYNELTGILEVYAFQLVIELEKYCDNHGCLDYLSLWNFLKDKKLNSLIGKQFLENLIDNCYQMTREYYSNNKL